jgi:hypothetical protein
MKEIYGGHSMMKELVVTFPEQWITAEKFEQALLRQTAPTSFESSTAITFRIPPFGKVMVEAAIRLLCLANQLAAEGVSVIMEFEGKQNDAMSWLNRANFFSVLSEQVHVLPHHPDSTVVQRYQGQSKNLVEFKSIGSSYDEQYVRSIPSQLADTLEAVLEAYPDRKSLGNATFAIFAELINNVYSHSQTVLDGFAALQVYPQGNKVQIVVSDSGVGLLETLKPKLSRVLGRNLPDEDLLRLLFHRDLAWSETRGIGLCGCAQKTLKYQGNVGLRLATYSITLQPSSGSYEKARVQYQPNLALIKGTHICFTFPLDISR